MKIGQAAARLAEAFPGRGKGAIVKAVRDLVAEKVLSTTGARGVNAPEATLRDGARLLIALGATDRPSLMADAVRDYGPLVGRKTHAPGIRRSVLGGPETVEFHDELGLGDTDWTLEDAIIRILEVLAATDPFDRKNPLIIVRFSGRCAFISADGYRYRFSNDHIVDPLYDIGLAKLTEEQRKEIARFDKYDDDIVEVERTVNQLALERFAKIFAGGGHE